MTTNAQPQRDNKAPIGVAAQRMATLLTERHVWLVQRVLTVLGLSRAEELLQQTLAVEAQGGMLTEDQQHRRTPGGVFLKLVKEQTTPAERKAIFSHPGYRGKKRPPRPEQASDDPPLPPVSWDEAQAEIVEVLKTPLGEATVKLTLIGRPLQVKELPSYVALALQGKEPPSLPKGLPAPPTGSTMRFVVFLTHKQWNGVKESLAHNPEDKLVIQGYPVFDPKRGTPVVLAQQVQSVEQEKAKKATAKAA